jgi:uncharacterized protein YjbI with pentapeptide repeats
MQDASELLDWDDEAFGGALSSARDGRIEAQNVRITERQLIELLGAAPRTLDESPRPDFQLVDFRGAVFLGPAMFDGVSFSGDASFEGTSFTEDACFNEAAFDGTADFGQASFVEDASFSRASFAENVSFGRARFVGAVDFSHASFRNSFFYEASFAFAKFNGASFSGTGTFLADDTLFDNPSFDGASFSGQASFVGAEFTGWRAGFEGASFSSLADFAGAKFGSNPNFNEARFHEMAAFNGAIFSEDGTATFDRASFSGSTSFLATVFGGGSTFREATFSGITTFTRAEFNHAEFIGARFREVAIFDRTRFSGGARFGEASFGGAVVFAGATFGESAEASFARASFVGIASFDRSSFGGSVNFDGARAEHDVRFLGTRFASACLIGPLLVSGELTFESSVFAERATIIALARRASFVGTEFRRGVDLRLRWAEVWCQDTDFREESLLVGLSTNLADDEGGLVSAHLSANNQASTALMAPVPRVLTLAGSRVARLTLSSVDLGECRFAATHGLDQLALERVTFPESPEGWRLTRRQTIAEEHYWRAAAADGVGWRLPRVVDADGNPRPPHPVTELGPDEIARLYRQLRKGREDSKDEPGANDFYYGEMEMRRRSGPRAERRLLFAYWLVSGYGLRAGRALLALLLAILVAAGALSLWGFDPSRSYGSSLLFALQDSISLLRAQTTPVTQSAGGQLIDVGLRLTGPLLVGLALLALRGRIKR